MYTLPAMLLVACVSPQFHLDLLMSGGSLQANVKDLKGNVVVQSNLKGKFNRTDWSATCLEGKCKIDLDLEEALGELSFETETMKVKTDILCQ